jgi:MAE_28990/MAE_18760-like HEPN
MPIRTANELADRLDESLAWRRIELQALKAAISDAEKQSAGSPLSRALARSGLALLYAHWEGYVKDSCTAYVEFIAKRRLRCDELSDGLLGTVLESLGKRILAGDEDALLTLIYAVRKPSESRPRIPKISMVDTKSNLRFNVLADILVKIGFSAEPFITKDKLIDVSLCDRRNSIAHGREDFPAPGDFTELLTEVMGMMEEIRDIIMSGARLKAYRHSSAASP